MKPHFYSTSAFAQKASVTIRTLRHYDKVGLLSPSCHTESGYRLYTDPDLLHLEQILALKFLGWSLDEIKRFLQNRPMDMQEALTFQKMMMEKKRAHVGAIIQAIIAGEAILQSNPYDLEAIFQVLQVIQRKEHLRENI